MPLPTDTNLLIVGNMLSTC